MKAWHVSSRLNRESIVQEGLRLSDSPSRYVWLFPRLTDALWAREGSWGGSRGDNDIWAVNITGLHIKPDPHPGWPGRPGIVVAEPISPERVDLACYLNEFEQWVTA